MPDPAPPDGPPRAAAWARKGAWTILDQALFAGANFVVNVLLARWLTPEGYGAYTVAFTVFLLLSVVHQGILTEPMLVFGPGRFRGRLAPYIGAVVRWHGLVTGIGVGLMALSALGVWLAGGPVVLAVGLLAVGVGQVGILLTWLTRSTSYITFEPRRSAEAGALYAVLLLGGTALLSWLGWLGQGRPIEVALAVGVMALAGLVAGLWLLRRAGLWPLPPADAGLRAEAIAAHREYGPWASASGGLDWVAGYLPLLWLSAAGGLAETGALRALYNLGLPAIHVAQALGTLMVPLFVTAIASGKGGRTLALWLGLAVAGGLAYAGALAVGGGPLLHALYDGKFDSVAGLMGVLGLVPLAIAVVVVLLSCLRALERPRLLFGARAVALAAVVAPVALMGGVETVRGALVLIAAIGGASAVLMGGAAIRELRRVGRNAPLTTAPLAAPPSEPASDDERPSGAEVPVDAEAPVDAEVSWT